MTNFTLRPASDADFPVHQKINPFNRDQPDGSGLEAFYRGGQRTG